jgi:hypothetical protein
VPEQREPRDVYRRVLVPDQLVDGRVQPSPGQS